jgi:ribosomal protein S8
MLHGFKKSGYLEHAVVIRKNRHKRKMEIQLAFLAEAL